MTDRLYSILDKKTDQVVALVEASNPAQAFARLCKSDYDIEVTKAIDVGPHIRSNGRVITNNVTQIANAITDANDADTLDVARDLIANVEDETLRGELLTLANMREAVLAKQPA